MKNTILAIALVAVAALFVGCDNPVNGDNNDNGPIVEPSELDPVNWCLPV